VTTQTAFGIRSYAGEVDLQPICDLTAACEAVDKLDDNPSPTDMRMWIGMPERDVERDTRLWEDESGRLAAFAMLLALPDEQAASAYFYFKIHPDARDTDLAEDVLAWGEGRVREIGVERGLPPVLKPDANEKDNYARDFLESHGYTPVRYFFLMRRPLNEPIPEHQLPEGFTLRHINPESDSDVERWIEMFNLSFIDHWDFHPATIERRRYRMSSPHYHAERDLIAVAPDGTFAGFCLCMINPEDNALKGRNEGWIAVLGTRRGYRKIGLGRAMLLAGLHRLKADGMDTAALGVDAENPTGALGLYESVGFEKSESEIAYRKDL
jgi:mycothiol synthase